MLERITAGEAVRDIITVLRARKDVTEALLAILAQVRGLLGASEAYIMLSDGERLRLRAADGLPRQAGAGGSLAVGEGIEGLAAALGEIATVPYASRHPRFRDPFGRPRPVGAMVVVPLVFSGRVTGVVAATRVEPGQFGGSNLWWLDVLGALAGLAIEDDRIYRAQERRARQAEVLVEVNAQAGVGPDELLPRLAAALSRALGASHVDLLLVDPAREELVSCGLSARGRQRLGPLARTSLAEAGLLARVFTSGRSMIVNDVRGEPQLYRLFGDRDIRSLLAVPITVSGERRGVLYLANEQPVEFTQDDLAFLSIVGARVGALIEAEDLRQRQLQLQRSEAEAQARQEFIGIVSHELKTPVAVIQAYTDLLLRRAEKAGDDANTDVVRRIAEQAERMLGLIEQLLDLQRLESGLLRLTISRFDLVGVAHRLVEGTQTTTQQHRLTVQADGPIVISADRRRVEEALQNLLDNAIKFSPDGGPIEVSVQLSETPGGGRAVVAVRDYGQGIDPDEQQRVFERFYQGGDRLRRGHVGLGLGLYISREIIRRHGGEMWLESTPGKGSVFYFSLPSLGPEEE